MYNNNISINIIESKEKIKGLVVLANARINSEDLSSFVKGIGNFFNNKLDILKGIFKPFGNVGKSEAVKPVEFKDISEFVKVMSNERKTIDKAANASYGVYEGLRIATVPGLTTNMIDATDKTIQMISIVNSVLDKKLDDLDTLISKVLGDENFRTSTRPIVHDTTTVNTINTLHKTINTFISPKQVQDTCLLKDIYPNMRSIKDCFEKLISTASHGSLEQLESYNNRIGKIVEKINALVDETKKRPDLVISKVVLKELSLETEEVAELVTISMNVFFLFNQITGVVRITASMVVR